MPRSGTACPADPPPGDLGNHRVRSAPPHPAPSGPAPGPVPGPAPGALPQPTASHAHLWSLPDGTGLHAPYGELVIESGTGRVCCHLCGRWYVSLGAHLRTHGHTAESYREEMGLCRTRRLIASSLARSISTRQRQAYRRSPAVRMRLAAGQELSRTGELARLARTTRTTPSVGASAELTRIRQAALDAGRATRAARREQARTERLAEFGIDDLADYLRREYAAGASLRDLATVTGLGWTRLRREVDAAGITLRPIGLTHIRQRQASNRRAEARAADRVGTEDLVGWLRERRAAGWSLTRLAAAVGHSRHWVHSRIARQPSIRPKAVIHPGQ